jgi:formylglycine-generating enzyme required for sulfatase activity
LEWCVDGRRDYDWDWQQDPLGPNKPGAARVIRGGSWYGSARFCRSAVRGRDDPGYRSGNLGFRCARVQP